MPKTQKKFAKPQQSAKNAPNTHLAPAKLSAKSSVKWSVKSLAQLSNVKARNSQAGDDSDDFTQVNYLTISEHQDGQRLDNFLLARLKGVPRSHVYKMIRDDEVRINKKRSKPHTRLAIGDVVRIAPVRLPSVGQVVVGGELQQALLSAVIYEDDGLIVLNKPYGLAVHGGSGERVGVIEALRVATGKKHLELIHRIDKGTSGLVMIAKKRTTLKELQTHFRQKTIQKGYLCLVSGWIKPDEQLIDKPLLKYTLPSGERRVKIDKAGKPSQTAISVLAHLRYHNTPISLVQACPQTGRTHQIRVHMASIGHALLGDDKYNPNDTTHRLCLHAYWLKVAGYPRFVAPLPSDLQALLEQSGYSADLVEQLEQLGHSRFNHADGDAF